MKIRIALAFVVLLFSTVSFGQLTPPVRDLFEVQGCYGDIRSDLLYQMAAGSDGPKEYIVAVSHGYLRLGGINGRITSVRNTDDGGKVTMASAQVGMCALLFTLVEPGKPSLTRKLSVLETSTGGGCDLVPVPNSP